ncbi:hypothetical protein TNCV_646701 [Trichonephila clavipes]|nr:hypothetical protein TNCV_646701 [Trichonephila clavipes]
MDDNAPCHRAVLIDDFLETENIQRMSWPANFPDLNPIEHYGFNAEFVEVKIGDVANYRPFGEFRRAKSYCHLYGVQGQRCHDEFRGPRSDYVRQVALETTTSITSPMKNSADIEKQHMGKKTHSTIEQASLNPTLPLALARLPLEGVYKFMQRKLVLFCHTYGER